MSLLRRQWVTLDEPTTLLTKLLSTWFGGDEADDLTDDRPRRLYEARVRSLEII